MANYDTSVPGREVDLGGMNRKPIPQLYGDVPRSNVAKNCLEALSIEAMGSPVSNGWFPGKDLGTYEPVDTTKKSK